MFSKVLALLCAIALASGVTLKLEDCNKSGKQSYAQVKRFDLSPQPVKIPGKLSWDMAADLNRNISGDVSMTLKLIRKSFLLDITLPCKDQIGSCFYPKMCSVVKDMVTEDWGGIGATVGNQFLQNTGGDLATIDFCKTGLAAQRIESKGTIDIPELPSLLSFIAAGDYTIHVELIDNKDNRVITCTDAYVTLEDSSSGGIWGKRKRRV